MPNIIYIEHPWYPRLNGTLIDKSNSVTLLLADSGIWICLPIISHLLLLKAYLETSSFIDTLLINPILLESRSPRMRFNE